MYNLSANILTGDAAHYVVTPNAQQVMGEIVNAYQRGVHSFTIIGTYGTGKSSFLLAMEADMQHKNITPMLLTPQTLNQNAQYEIVNVVGDYAELATLLEDAIPCKEKGNVLDNLSSFYRQIETEGKLLVLVIDEFGKVLEHAAKNNPERELYFLQKLAELVNVSERKILLVTTLHQNFSAYANSLNSYQLNEWNKVKGRFQEVVFAEPVEQLLYLVSKQIGCSSSSHNGAELLRLAKQAGLTSDVLTEDVVSSIFPLEPFSAIVLTHIIQRYGQNERSLFSFLGQLEVDKGNARKELYHLAKVYDYAIRNFYSVIHDRNSNAIGWASIHVSIERAEGCTWSCVEDERAAVDLIKVIGLLNMFGKAGYQLSHDMLASYAKSAMAIENAGDILNILVRQHIIRFAVYKGCYILFEGTDIDIENELIKASSVVPRPVEWVNALRHYFNRRVTGVRASYYRTGTPRFFEFVLTSEMLDLQPEGDVDGFVQLLFPQKDDVVKLVQEQSNVDRRATVYAIFVNTKQIVDHLYEIDKLDYLLAHVLIDKSERAAIREIKNQRDYEIQTLNHVLADSLWGFQSNVVWVYNGEICEIHSQRDFNRLLSRVCDEVYFETPVINNELLNRHKLSSTVNSARVRYLDALMKNGSLPDLGFCTDTFPPEKAIYYSLLKDTGLHENGVFQQRPSSDGVLSLWNACEQFLKSTVAHPRNISELQKLLLSAPYKLKQGLLDVWLPTYLFVKRQDYALYDAESGRYIPEVETVLSQLLQKNIAKYEIKAFQIDGVNLAFFNQYRKFIHLSDNEGITSEKFVETIKPFFHFYNKQLGNYAKTTRKFGHISTLRFRDVLASAKDPEKAFFEDIPAALGFDRNSINKDEFIDNYCQTIQCAIRELRTCYSNLIDRIEAHIVAEFNLSSFEYPVYVKEIHNRLSRVKTHLLTDKQREFYLHVMTEFSDRMEWYQSICYSVLDCPLDRLHDEQEESLMDNLVYLLRTCEKYASISSLIENNEDDRVFAIDLISNTGTTIRNSTYRLPDKDRVRAQKLRLQLETILSGESNLDICVLLELLQQKMKE